MPWGQMDTHIIEPLHPNDSNLQVESLTKTKLEHLCLSEAGQHFIKASNTPSLQPPLIDLFTKVNVHTVASNQVLAGMFICPENTDPMACCLIQALKQPSPHMLIPTQTLGEITAGWCKAREPTSSSPSTIHFGHYMARTFNPTISVFKARLVYFGFTTSYSLKWWQMGLNVMLEKQSSNLNVDKLWIILLFKGNFNSNKNGWDMWLCFM